MNKKVELKTIIDSLNNLMGKIDSVDEPKPSTDFTTGNNAFKHLQKPKYPEGILSFKTCYDQIVSFKNQVGNYQNWCNGHLGKERENIVPSTIHSVKNSKGEVFTIGDLTQYGNITGFTLGAEDVYASFEGGYTVSSPVDWLVKKEPQPSWKDQIVAYRWNGEVYYRNVATFSFSRYDTSIGARTLKEEEQTEIFRVRNKAGVKFSVGDYAHYENGSEVKINSFFISNGLDSSLHEIIIAMHSNGSCGIDLLTKAEPKKEPKPLFKTEDGFDVFEGDGYFAVRNSDFHICEYAALFAKYLVDEGYYTRFKHKSNAEKYVAENKKSISYKELEDYVVLTTPFLKLPEQVSLRNILNHFKPQ